MIKGSYTNKGNSRRTALGSYITLTDMVGPLRETTDLSLAYCNRDSTPWLDWLA